MMTLASQLETVTGKKKYGYLPKDVKRTVNEIINQMERFPVVADCYQTWWEHQCQIEDFYLEKERQRPPLSDQKEFRSIKNAVIQEAENIRLGKVTFEDKGAEAMAAHAATDISSLPYDCWKLWIIADDDTAPMAERDRAAAQIIREAENSDPYAQYLTGKLYRDGPVLIPDSVESLYWFEQAARQDHVAAQYETGKLLLSHDPEVHDPELGIPRHTPGPESSSRNHGKLHGPGYVAKNRPTNQRKPGERFLSGPLPSVVVHPIVGQRVGQTKTAKINPPKLF